jgi:hypothetical protein
MYVASIIKILYHSIGSLKCLTEKRTNRVMIKKFKNVWKFTSNISSIKIHHKQFTARVIHRGKNPLETQFTSGNFTAILIKKIDKFSA